MIVNPIAIATRGVYANDRNIALATHGYVDISVVVTPEQDGNFVGFVQGLREEDELLMVIQAFLHMRNL